tara:strand:- start:832 stop:1740 length:909 start_codon:yes stop_codon:yes gene_type:complete
MSGKEEDKGICFFAYNNDEIDYVQLAHIAAGYVKANMSNNKTCLITDKGTYNYFKDTVDNKFRDACFDQVILTDFVNSTNPRRHYDSPWTEFTAQFNNSNKHKIFEYTPFEKTLLLDIDYIVKNNFYDYIFDTKFPLAMHRESQYLQYEPPYMNEITLSDGGVHHWWSTVVYFDQSFESKTFFDTWAHVKDNWDYYHLLYQFPPALFRTDFCVSIACHLLNGYNENNFVHDFLGTRMRNMDQKDDLIEVKSLNDWIFLSHVRKEVWKNILVRNQDLNVHVMNKRALTRHATPIIESLKEAIL